MERYFLGQDQSCHWYLVPEIRRVEWEAWENIPESDERSWDAPEWAKPINSPHAISFTNPQDAP